MALANNLFDISLQQDSSATIYGFMLAKKNGVKLLHIEDAPYLNPGFYTSNPSYANAPPEQEFTIAQDEWHSNFGLQDSAIGSEKKYRTSYGVDLRQKGRAYNGPASGTLTLPTNCAPPIKNTGFETTDPPANWAVLSGGGAWSRSSTFAQAGTYSGKIAGAVSATTVEQVTVPWDNIYQGGAFVLTCYIYQPTGSANFALIGLNDGVTTTWSTASATVDSWTQITLNKTLDAAATALTVYVKHNGTSNNIYFDTIALSSNVATTGNYIRYIDYNSALYIARGTSLLKYTGSGNWVHVASFNTTITDLAVLGSQLFVAIGTAAFMFYSAASDDTDWTQATTANNKAQFFGEISGTLWYNDEDAKIRNITSANGSASAQTTVGLTTTDITGLIQHAGLLYIMKTDQPYERASGGGITAILPEAVSEVGTTSGKNPLSYKGDLFIQTGSQGLWKWKSATDIETVSPAKFAVAESDFGGKILAMANDSEYLYAILDNTTKVEVLAGREETIDSVTDWRWHPIAELTLSICNHAWVSTVGSKRLWLLGDSADTPTFYYLPANYADPTTDSTYQRNLSGIFYTPWYSGAFIDVTKAFFSLTLLSSGLTANLTIAVDYQLLGDGSWTTGWTFGASASPSKINYFAADTTSRKIRFKLTFVSNSATSSPILLGLILRGSLMPVKRKKLDFTVRVADNITTRKGVPDTNRSHVLETALNAYDAETWPVILTVPDNSSATEGATTAYNVKFRQMGRTEVFDEETKRPEVWFDINAVECKIA